MIVLLATSRPSFRIDQLGNNWRILEFMCQGLGLPSQCRAARLELLKMQTTGSTSRHLNILGRSSMHPKARAGSFRARPSDGTCMRR
jgi:hypothetical protein